MCILESLEQAIASLRNQELVTASLHDILAPLKKYDDDHGTDLVHTLYVYILHTGNVTVTAEILFLHRNSVLYRLQRAEEVSGIKIRNIQTRRLLFTAFALTDPRFLSNSNLKKEGNDYENKRKE
jgi:DNA-binding PucR family transcriptional regulator